MVPRCTTLETSRRAKPMDTLRTVVNAAFSTLLCLAILLWSVVPATSHAPYRHTKSNDLRASDRLRANSALHSIINTYAESNP